MTSEDLPEPDPYDWEPEPDPEPYWDGRSQGEEPQVTPASEASGGARTPQVQTYPAPDTELPELTPEDESKVEGWWKKMKPVFRKRRVEEMLQGVEAALTEMPELLVYLGLHEGLLFELAADLARKGRYSDLLTLFQRIRREQPRLYSFCYGAYDHYVIAELLVAGRTVEIPDYLDFFRKYPDAEPDYAHQLCNLLAWSDQPELLYLLCEAIAKPMLTSAKVVGGGFVIDWLIRREEIPFFETSEATSATATAAGEEVRKLGERLGYPLRSDAEWIGTGLAAYHQPPRVEPVVKFNSVALRHLGFNWLGYVRRHTRLSWHRGFLLEEMLQAFLVYSHEQKFPPFRLSRKDMEGFVIFRAQKLFTVDGILMLAILQMFVWLAEYLQAAGVLDPAERDQVRADARKLFLTGRKMVEATDPAYRLCSDFGRLIQADQG